MLRKLIVRVLARAVHFRITCGLAAFYCEHGYVFDLHGKRSNLLTR